MKLICFHRKTVNCSAKFIKFNEVENKIFLDALFKSDARWDGKQEIFLYGLISIMKIQRQWLDLGAARVYLDTIRIKYGYDLYCNFIHSE